MRSVPSSPDNPIRLADAAERPAFSPRDLARRWECSERHVRTLVNTGRLRSFKLGEKLVRVPHWAVEEFEQCQNTEPSGTEAGGRRSGTKTGSGNENLSRRPFIVMLQKPSSNSKRSTKPSNAQRSST